MERAMSESHKLTILIVDDSMSARMIMKQAFPESIKKHAIFIEAVDGLKGVEAFKEHSPDIVFMDLTMPNMNGKEALAEIKKLSPKTIVVMVTADRQRETKNELLEAGAAKVMHKPVDMDELRDAMTQLAFEGEQL
jgi:two-component system, chemotaxis family, chemotaxis protein CheY